MLKVMTVVGTRPEIIRLSRVIHRLDATVDHVLVHTGQNYDYALNEVFFDDLGIRQPDHMLGVDTSSLGRGSRRGPHRRREGDARGEAGRRARARRHQLLHRRGHGQADANSRLPHGGRQPLLRRERAGGDQPPARRPRRRLQPGLHRARASQPAGRGAAPAPHHQDRFADARGARRLPRRRSSLRRARASRPRQRAATSLSALTARRTSTTPTVSRRSSTASWRCAAAYELPVFVSTHPRTRKRLEALPEWAAPEGITFIEPFGFHDYNRLQLGAACFLSDSGTIAEESTLLGFPAVTLRDSIERPEALDTGGIIMTGLERDDVVAAVGVAMDAGTHAARRRPPHARRLPHRQHQRAGRQLHPLHGAPPPAWAGIRTSS